MFPLSFPSSLTPQHAIEVITNVVSVHVEADCGAGCRYFLVKFLKDLLMITVLFHISSLKVALVGEMIVTKSTPVYSSIYVSWLSCFIPHCAHGLKKCCGYIYRLDYYIDEARFEIMFS